MRADPFSLLQADCKFLRQLGEGATATVDLFSVELAVKRPKTKEEAERLEEEGSTMASLHHPGLPAPVCWIEPADGSPRGLAMPLIRGGTLHSRIWCAWFPCLDFLENVSINEFMTAASLCMVQTVQPCSEGRFTVISASQEVKVSALHILQRSVSVRASANWVFRSGAMTHR